MDYKDQAPWYVAALTTLGALVRELVSTPEACAVQSIEDLERIIRIAQGL